MPLHYNPVLSPLRVATPPHGYERPAGLPRYTVKTIVAWLPRLTRLPCVACRGQLRAEWPIDFAGRVVCLSCGREYAEIVDTLPTPLPPHLKEDRRRRGRPPQSLTEPMDPSALCIDCGLRRPKYQRRRCGPCVIARTHRRHLCPDCQTRFASSPQCERCSPCAFAYRRNTSAAGRLIALLADGRQHGRDELYVVLRVSNQQLRSAIRRARADGYAIKLVESGYRLGGVS
jgi:biotin operon repressor